MITGVLPVDKPSGWTSHDVVARIRRVAGQRQVGHAGTLDPLATGVLLLVLGSATKLSWYLMASPKAYCAEVVLGATTVTDDAEAPLVHRVDALSLPRTAIDRCLLRFIGEIDQVPPAYAAIRQGGEKLYRLARQGIEVETPPRRVSIEAVEVLRWEPPRLSLLVRCGPGTYIRSLARDIGADLGVGGYLHGLRRISSGMFPVEECAPMDTLTDQEAILQRLRPPDQALLGYPAVVLNPEEARRFCMGQALDREGGESPAETIRMYDATGALVALGRYTGERLEPVKVFMAPARNADRPLEPE